LENGLDNPVQFGQDHKGEIGELVRIADLSLAPFAESRKDLKAALESTDPWERYWALISCSIVGKEALEFYQIAWEMAKNDQENLVRIRAVEFLTLTDHKVPQQLFMDIFKNAKSESEINLILNTVALLETVKPDFDITIPKDMFPFGWTQKEGDYVNRRLDFINNSGNTN